ncbi:monocarboxylate transporter 13-like [Wyeomyia smithii]|uniref:monocarboxylate transporter 13-like n=1 Tax=Wyeomyia smithii TaxID=174621 RepID=UPI002467B82B|nr:monocarboxylate transporter 13-like [Wyeomyia smithii]
MAELAQLRPPDGGWGWMVVFAYGMANIMIIPVLQSFGLIFKDTFKQINVSATGASLIINLASSVGMTFGLFNGPLLRNFGFRKVAAAGGTMFSLGLMLTSTAQTFAHFIITYSIIASLGMGFCNSSFSLALNTYFVVRRNKAAGIAMTITGLGPILLPQLVSLLVGLYDPRSCLLIIGALATHIIAASLLLQPVKWHMIPVEQKHDSVTGKDSSDDKSSAVDAIVPVQNCRNNTDNGIWEAESDTEEGYLEEQSYLTDHETDAQSIYGFELTSQIRRRDSIAALSRAKSEVFHPVQRRPSLVENLTFKSGSQSLGTTPEKRRWFQADSDESVNLGSSLKIFDERERRNSMDTVMPKRKLSGIFTGRRPSIKRWFEKSEDSVHLSSSLRIFEARRGSHPSLRESSPALPTVSNSKLPVLSENQGLTEDNRFPSIMRQLDRPNATRPSGSKTTTFKLDNVDGDIPNQQKKTFAQKVVALFDLTLLKDKIYVNMMLGMAVSVFAEINFSLMTPFILSDLGYRTEQIASIMSTLAVADLIFRFISPFVGDFLRLSPRIMYMISLSMLIVFRFSILIARNYAEMIAVAFFLGVAKGVRTVYMGLVIPSYIPIKRLPSASSIQMMMNGVILMMIGPLVGLIRDLSGSYSKSILLINAFTIVTLIMWAIEMAYVKRKSRQKQLEAAAGAGLCDR